MSLLVERRNERVEVRGSGGELVATGERLMIHGCDTAVPSAGRLTIDGHQETWTHHGTVHVSDQRRPAPGEPGEAARGEQAVNPTEESV